MEVVCFDTLIRYSDEHGFLSPALPTSGQAGWRFPIWERQKGAASKSAVQGSAIHAV
jgi:hypothetical protein